MKRVLFALAIVAGLVSDASAVVRSRSVVVNRNVNRGFRANNVVVVNRNFGNFGFVQSRNFGVFVAPSPVFLQPTFVQPAFVQPFGFNSGFQSFGTFNTFGCH